MADKSETSMFNRENDNSDNVIPPWASGEDLRHVEKDVLIPKIVRERARTEKCRDLVEGKGLFRSTFFAQSFSQIIIDVRIQCCNLIIHLIVLFGREIFNTE